MIGYLGNGALIDEMNEKNHEVPRKETEDVTEERMYSETEMILIAETMGGLGYAQGFKEGASIDASDPEEKSKFVEQVLNMRRTNLGNLEKIIPPRLREKISLPLEYD